MKALALLLALLSPACMLHTRGLAEEPHDETYIETLPDGEVYTWTVHCKEGSIERVRITFPASGGGLIQSEELPEGRWYFAAQGAGDWTAVLRCG